MELGGGYDAQLRLGLAIVLVEEFVGEVVRSAEQEVRVEGTEFAKIDVAVKVLGECWILCICGGLTPAMRRTYSV